MKMNDIRIAHQLRLGFGAMALLIALVSGIALAKIDIVDKAFDVALEREYPVVIELYEAEGHINETAQATRNLLLVAGSDAIKSELARIAESRRKINAIFDQLRSQMSSEHSKASLARLTEARAAYVRSLDTILELVAAGKFDDAKALLLGQMQSTQAAYLKTLDEVIDYQSGVMKAEADGANAAVVTSKVTACAGAGIALVFAALMSGWITRSITRPLADAVAVARSVADGDLRREVHAVGTNETAQLLHALNDMQSRLSKVVWNVRQGSHSVATASAQIAQGSQDLSQRTEEQAAALEQTAASMEELGSTVTQNADHARQANQLALNASSVAAEGGRVVSQVVETMRDINDSSRQIADIIGVIDGIAFQTNILALNAAVEAARAGEQGRGFAVVASEVRNLAQRSAGAAKEIKGLIGASVERVGHGTLLVDQAGATMTEVVTSIKRVTDIMGEISAASAEQSAGVAQIGDAVSQMDQTTQQNAALVEQSAAAASSLNEQAQQLVQVVATFRLGDEGGTPRQAAAVPHTEPAAAARPAAVERRSPNRATNVVRPVFTPLPARTLQAAPVAPAATGTGEWESF